MLIIDGDYPMAHGATQLGRDLTLPIEVVRAADPNEIRNEYGEAEAVGEWKMDQYAMCSLPEMRRAEIAAALVKVVACIKRSIHPHGEYRSDENAYAGAMADLAYYKILEAKNEVRILANSSDFGDHMALWDAANDHSDQSVGFVLGMEGADAIVWPEQVHEWYAEGLRVVSLSHYGVSRYSHGTATGTEGGLLDGATELLREMDSLGMILDVSHTSDQSVLEELDAFDGPVLSSHQNVRAIAPGERQIPDDLLKQIIDRGAVIGTSMDTWMLYTGGLDWTNIPHPREVFAREDVTLKDYVDHMDYVCQMAGNSNHAAIGGDTDGQGGYPEAPYEIDTVADYQKVADELDRRGYKQEDVENIMYRNWQRFFEKWLPA